MKYRILSNATANGISVWSYPNHTPYGIAVLMNPTNGALFCKIKWEK